MINQGRLMATARSGQGNRPWRIGPNSDGRRGGGGGSAAATRRDPALSKALILSAAQDEFAERGLNGARVDRIARRAGAGKNLIYHYFGNKAPPLSRGSRKHLSRDARATG